MSTTRYSDHSASSSTLAQINAASLGNTEFPPPPPDILQNSTDVTDFSQSPEFPNPPQMPTIPKELYSKQRNLYELNRLYKHIHPELRKNLEKDYISEVSDIVSSQINSANSFSADVQQARYVFENTSDSSQKKLNSEREHLEWDEILKGEVQSMRWIFENQPLDSINNDSQEEDNTPKGIADQEIIAGGDVKYTTWMFETQPIDALGFHSTDTKENTEKIPELARGDVRTARWMFETKPLDSMNKMHQSPDELEENAMKDITGGDVKTVRYMFETQQLDQLGQLHSVDEVYLLQLRSELKEIKGNVKRSIKCFETQPLYVIRDGSGHMLEIKTVHREDVERGDVRTARWMFETQPLDTINKDITEIKVVRGISMEENVKGGVSRAKWLFETQPLEKIKEDSEETITEKEAIMGADVSRKCWMFETQPLDILKDTPSPDPVQSEEILGGDVQATKHLFETLPIEALKDSPDVGKLEKITASEEERGDVRHQKWVFETQPLENIREDKRECIRTVKLETVDKGDVRNYTHMFESNNLIKYDASHKIEVEGVTRGVVELNKSLFEKRPLYAIQDHLGQYHEVKTVKHEEILRGDVKSFRWLFETTPIDQFDESLHKFQVIRGISAQEIQTGNVKSAKWLFESQPLDSIKYFSNMEGVETESKQTIDIVKGDVKTCRWLFETQPMESLYEKVSLVSDSDEIHKGDVKTCTWLFETQPLDSIKNDSEATAKLQTVKQEEIKGGDVHTARHVFETENLDRIQGEEGKEIKAVEIDIQAGDVSSMRQKFENQPLDAISSSSEEVLEKIKTLKTDDIQKGNVLNCRWLFENQPIDKIKESQGEDELVTTVKDIQGGDVRKGCFIFETFSLDEIKEETDSISTKKLLTEEAIKGDVKSCRMLFETQPLYAIQDRGGFYHEVTTVKKEEVIHGDVRGTRWLFETKPLDSINESETVYVIKSVTQEDIQKGDVSAVRYRFETQPLDQISEESHTTVPTVDCIQGGNVKTSKQFFESENYDQDTYVRTVSVNEIQKGNVKISTWLFETHTLDELRGEEAENDNIKMVTQENMQKGDVKQAIWLFETQSLDSIKEAEENITNIIKEKLPSSDIKTTTWLFETTPLHKFHENMVKGEEIIGKSIKETLKELYSQKFIEAPGIIIEADEVGDVRMAKYKLMNQAAPHIQKEEMVRVDLKNIIEHLLSKRDHSRRDILVSEEEKGNVNLTKTQLLNRSTEYHAEKEEIVSGDVQQAIKNLFSAERSEKKGILIQEDERGDIKMTLYCLLHENAGETIEHEKVKGGDVRGTIHNLLSFTSNNAISERMKIDASERGNVRFFTTCIETGALDYLKQLQTGSNETVTAREQEKEEEIIGGDVQGTKLLLKKKQSQVERTVNETDIIPGDVHNTVKVFMTKPQSVSCNTLNEEIANSDLKSTLNSFSQAINQERVTKTQDIIKSDTLDSLKSFDESSHQKKESKQPHDISTDLVQAIECLEKTANTRTEILKKELLLNDLETSLRNLKEAERSFREVDKKCGTIENVQAGQQKAKGLQKDIQGYKQSVLQPRPGPFEPTPKWWQGKTDNINPDTKKSCQENLIEESAWVNLPKAPKGTVKIVIDREQNNDALEKSLRRLSNSTTHQETIKGVLESEEKTDACTDTTRGQYLRNEHKSRQLASTLSVKKNLKSKESETVQKQMDDIFNSTLSSKKTVGTQQTQTCQLRNDHQMMETYPPKNAKNLKNVKISDIQSFQPYSTQVPNNNVKGETCEIMRDFQKQTLLTQEMQYSNKDIKKKNVSFQPVCQNFPLNQDIANVLTERKVSQKGQDILKTTEKQKTDVHLSSQDFLMKTNTTRDLKKAMEMSLNSINLNPENNVKESESSLPPPSPPPPPPSNASSEIEFPLPPPPPLILLPEKNTLSPSFSTEKNKAEFESFPGLLLPPPAEDEKSDRECVSMYQPSPSPPTSSLKQAFLSSSVQENHNEVVTQCFQENSINSQQTLKLSQAKNLAEKSGRRVPPPTLPKPKFFKKNDGLSKVELKNSFPDVESQITLSKDQKEGIKVKVNEHQESLPKNMLDERQLSMPLASSLPKKAPEIPPFKGKQIAPLLKSHSFPTVLGQQSPKPYMSKFRTPLMIAEEKYRQQKEELERQKQASSCFSMVKTESQNQNKTEFEKEVLLQNTNEASQSRMDSKITVDQANLYAQRNSQLVGMCTDNQVCTTPAVTNTAKKLQNVLTVSEDKDTMKKEVLQSSEDIKQFTAVCENKQNHKESSAQQIQQKKCLDPLNLLQIKPVAPDFKVKTIKLPTLDYKINDILHSYESHKKKSELDIQTITKEQYQENKKTEASTEYHNKQFIDEKYCKFPKKEKKVSITLPKDPIGKCHESKFNIVPEPQKECIESGGDKYPESEGMIQELPMTDSKEERLMMEKKQEPLNQTAQKVVKHKIAGTHLDSQTQSFQQTQIKTSETQVECKKLSQPYNNLQEEKCLGIKGAQQKQVFSNTKEPKLEITQNKSLFSSVKESQQEDRKCAVNILEFLRKREELQHILSRVKQFEVEPNKNCLKTFQTLLNIIPVWLLSEDKREHGRRIAMENNVERIKEEITHIKTQAEDMLLSCENIIQIAMKSSKVGKQSNNPTNISEKIAQISNVDGSYNKSTKQKENITVEKTERQQQATHHESNTQNLVKTHQELKVDHRKISSPTLKTRSQSPTFITIESTARRTEASTNDGNSQPPKKDSFAESSPRRPMTATSRIHRANSSPSPPRSRSEQLVKLKDTTAKLFRGTIPSPSVTPVPIVETRSEIITSPATLRRQIKIESLGRNSSPTITIPINVNHIDSSSFRESVEAQEKVRKVEKRETYVHKDGVTTINHIVPDTESFDAVEIIRKFEGPHMSEHTERYEATNRAAQMAEDLINEHENEINRWLKEFEGSPIFETNSTKRVYTNGEANHNIKQESSTFCKEFGLSSSENKSFTGFSYDRDRARESQEKIPVRQPKVQSETTSLRERFSDVDGFDSQVVGSKITVSSSRSSEASKPGFDFKHAPPTYEDVIAGHILDISDSPKGLRRNFQETWQESERVFKNQGYAASDASAAEIRTTFQEESEFRRGK